MSDYNKIQSSLQELGTNAARCPKCLKKFSACICSKSGSDEKDEEKSFEGIKETESKLNQNHTGHFVTHDSSFAEDPNKVDLQLLLYSQEHQFQLTLKPDVNLQDIKTLLEEFIRELAGNSNLELSNENLTIKELGEKLGIHSTDSDQKNLEITIENQEHLAIFLNRLVDNNLIESPQELKQTMDNVTRHEEISESFNPSPFTMKFTPY